tara:strand:+ start:117 stop:671 length:555 start_codon:yes stop_codon:yes gene_type:complete
MPTVVELRAIIKKHQFKNCPKTSKMKKDELLEVVSRIKRVRTQRELGVDVIKKKKALKKSLVLKDEKDKGVSKIKPVTKKADKKSLVLKEGKNKGVSKIKPLTAPKKSFTSTGSMKIPKRRKITAAENKSYNTIIASAPKKWQDFVKNLLTKLTPSQKNGFKVKIASIKMNQVINYIQSVAAEV